MDWYVSCPAWEYKDVIGFEQILAARAAIVLRWVWTISQDDRVSNVIDTRTIHEKYFQSLTPVRYEYYAGHYRGEKYPCLVDYPVGIKGNSNVGHDAVTVPLEMMDFAQSVLDAIRRLDVAWSVNEAVFSKGNKIRRLAELVAALFSNFLEIHPYANGNGHMARLLAIAIFSRYGILLKKWPLHPRPPDPPYSNVIRDYQHGKTEDLIVFLMKCI